MYYVICNKYVISIEWCRYVNVLMSLYMKFIKKKKMLVECGYMKTFIFSIFCWRHYWEQKLIFIVRIRLWAFISPNFPLNKQNQLNHFFWKIVPSSFYVIFFLIFFYIVIFFDLFSFSSFYFSFFLLFFHITKNKKNVSFPSLSFCRYFFLTVNF